MFLASEDFKSIKEEDTVYKGMVGLVAGKGSSNVWVASNTNLGCWIQSPWNLRG
jgi:hypothetical protein